MILSPTHYQLVSTFLCRTEFTLDAGLRKALHSSLGSVVGHHAEVSVRSAVELLDAL